MSLIEYFGVPVTGLLLYNEHLYAGCGGNLKIFKTKDESYDFVQQKFIFKHAVIHAIKTFKHEKDQYLIVFGGKKLVVLSIEDLKVVCEFAANDWILDVAPITYKSTTQLAIALSHNSCVLLDWKNNHKILEVHCSEKCILYCAHFVKITRQTNWDDLIFCAGTVFNQVVVWKPGVTNELKKVKPLDRIDGHDGVIFDIYYCEKHKILLTASDDRSIRMWSCPAIDQPSEKLFPWRHLCVLYAHEARIWKVRILEYDSKPYIVSVSEDGCCIIWELKLNLKESCNAVVARKLKLRGNLLCLSLDGKGNFAIGCSSGAIYQYSITNLLPGLIEVKVDSFSKEDFGTPKVVKILQHGNFSALVHTDKGFLFVFEFSSAQWTLLHHSSNYSSYTVLTLNETESMVAIGNTKGDVMLLCLDDLHEVTSSKETKVFDGKVQNLSWSENDLFLSGPDGQLKWFTVRDNQLVNRCTFILPKAKHRWHIDVIKVKDATSLYILCGDRRGSVHLFAERTPEALCTAFGVHGKNGVTSLTSHNGDIVSTGRDGYWRKWKVSDNKVKLLTKHRAAQGMEWLEKCEVAFSKDNLFIYGFHGNKFVAWSSYSGNELFSVLCGGCHRSWDFSPQLSKFVYLKESQLHIVEVPEKILQDPIVELGYHRNHINCARILDRYVTEGGIVTIVATASEDTKVIISAIVQSKKRSERKVLHVIDDHCSSVRSLCVVTKADSDVSKEVIVMSAGGRATLNVYLLKIYKDIKIVTELSTMADYGGTMAMDAMRFMDVTAWRSGDGVSHEVAVACSNGEIQKFLLKNNSLTLTDKSEAIRHCFLVTSHINDVIVSGATDGFLYFMTSSLQLLFRTKTNQSGVNAISYCDVAMDDVTYSCVATAGDDNSIRLMTFQTDYDVGAREVSNCVVEDCHSAQVTGLHCTATDQGIALISTSIDQRATKWSFNLCENSGRILKFENQGTKFLHVSDVSGMHVIDDCCVISGRGIAMFDCSDW